MRKKVQLDVFFMYESYWPMISLLTNEQAGWLLKALLCQHGAPIRCPKYDVRTFQCLGIIQHDMEERIRRSEKLSAIRRKAGSRGGAAARDRRHADAGGTTPPDGGDRREEGQAQPEAAAGKPN